jgi:murein DD-endopeptidase MepM/ murein hydrolase activator NlpD
MVEAINEKGYTETGKDFAQTMEDFFPSEKRKPFFENLSAQYGKIQSIGEPRLTPPSQAIFVAHCERGKLDITVWLDDNDKVIGLLFLPHKADIPVPDKHQTQLSLPFRGQWLVFWGGDTNELNQHHDTPNQRFAFDFLGADEKGKTHKGEGKLNEDYFAFGREILAPADGIVTDVINGVRDNVPGSMNPYSALGNTIFIEHREYEVSVLAHLKLDSIKVKVGDKVKRGQIIGLCGNSGNSSEPHLHYHLQNTPIIQDGTGIKCNFQNVTLIKDGKKEPKTNYSPTKGEIIFAQ